MHPPTFKRPLHLAPAKEAQGSALPGAGAIGLHPGQALKLLAERAGAPGLPRRHDAIAEG